VTRRVGGFFEMPTNNGHSVASRQEVIGNKLSELRAASPDKPLSELADMLGGFEHIVADETPSLAEQAKQAYQTELRERAEAGDRFAISMLAGHAFHEPGDE
jgi:hypothetical protein